MKYALKDRYSVGVAVPLPAIRTAKSGGIGEFPDLIELGALCRSVGVAGIQLLPVNDSGRQSSPYSAQSAFALHPLYLRLADLPEAAGSEAGLAAVKAAHESAVRFDYTGLLDAKVALLKEMFAKHRKAIAADKRLAEWVAANRWLKPYAVFCALKERNQYRGWREWTEHRDPSMRDIDSLARHRTMADDVLFHSWVQFRCEEQFSRAARELAAMGVFLKGDLPILMNEDSADVWSRRDYFDSGLRAGAPPDMFSHFGQNWGFPVYNWAAIEKDGFEFWIDRLKQADKFYAAYRIDHVLGFFRIWAMGDREESGYLGRFVPGMPIARGKLAELGFDDARIRWLSEPHLRGQDFTHALRDIRNPADESSKALQAATDRLGNEDLFLFKRTIRGERDILALSIHEKAREWLVAAWRNRVFLDTSLAEGRSATDNPDSTYVPTWRYFESTAWSTLSAAEREALERLFVTTREAEEREWEVHGERLLAQLKKATGMLACAEDLGAVPACVPVTLDRLGILALRIPRWAREWSTPGNPFIPLSAYPTLSVCTPSVHDTSTLRDWWEHEPGRYEFWNFLHGKEPTAASDGCPDAWTPELAGTLLSKLSGASSLLFVVQIQDLLDLCATTTTPDSRSDRVNVPGTVTGFNWTYRMPVAVDYLATNADWKAAVTAVVAARPGTR